MKARQPAAAGWARPKRRYLRTWPDKLARVNPPPRPARRGAACPAGWLGWRLRPATPGTSPVSTRGHDVSRSWETGQRAAGAAAGADGAAGPCWRLESRSCSAIAAAPPPSRTPRSSLLSFPADHSQSWPLEPHVLDPAPSRPGQVGPAATCRHDALVGHRQSWVQHRFQAGGGQGMLRGQGTTFPPRPSDHPGSRWLPIRLLLSPSLCWRSSESLDWGASLMCVGFQNHPDESCTLFGTLGAPPRERGGETEAETVSSCPRAGWCLWRRGGQGKSVCRSME